MAPPSNTSICASSQLVVRNRPGPQAPVTNDIYVLGLAQFVAAYLINFLCVLLWLLFKGNYERTKVRPTVLVLLAALGSITQVNSGPSGYVWVDTIPCSFYVINLILIIPLVGGGVVMKILIFFFLAKFSHTAAETAPTIMGGARGAVEDSSTNGAPPSSRGEEEIEDIAKHNAQLRGFRGTVLYIALKSIFITSDAEKADEGDRVRLLYALRFLVSNAGMAMLVLTILLPFFILAVVYAVKDPAIRQCSGCALWDDLQSAMIAIAAIIIAFGIGMSFRTRHFKDPWRIQREASVAVGCCVISFAGFIAGIIRPRRGTESYDSSVIITVGFLLNIIFQTVYQLAVGAMNEGIKFESPFLESLLRNGFMASLPYGSGTRGGESRRGREHKRSDRRGVESLVASSTAEKQGTASSTGVGGTKSSVMVHPGGTGHLTVDIIESNPRLRGLFEEHLVAEFAIEMLLFYRDAADWKSRYYDIAANANKARAKRIYATYVKSGGIYEVNISDTLKRRIEKDLLEREVVEQTLFDRAMAEMKALLNSGAVARFQKTKAYLEAGVPNVHGSRENSEGGGDA